MGNISNISSMFNSRAEAAAAQDDYGAAQQAMMNSYMANSYSNPNPSIANLTGSTRTTANIALNRIASMQAVDKLFQGQAAALQTQVAQQEAHVAEQQAELDATQQSYWDANARAEALRQLQAQRTAGSMLGSSESPAPSTKALLGVG